MIRQTSGLAALALVAACQQPSEGGGAATTSPTVPTATPVAAASAAVPVCAANETPIFACRFPDRKRVAVCGTAPGKAEYRFGGDTAELSLSGGERARVMYSGGGESQLAFTNGDTRYIVFSRMVRTGFGEEGNNPAISDGVVVDRAGTFTAIRLCDDSDMVPVDVDAAETFLPPAAGGELFTDETYRADPPVSE